jgi:hypothetical protein
MPPIGITTYPEFSDPRLKEMKQKVSMLAKDKAMGDSDKVYKPKDVDGWTWEVRLFQGIAEMTYVPDGADPDNDQPRPDYSITRGVIQEGIGVKITQFTLDQSPRWRQVITESLADSPRKTNETRRQAHYEQSLEGVTVSTVNGRNVVDVRAYDGLSFFNDAHTFKGTGIENSNLSASARTWSKTNCASMIKQARGWKNYDGHPMQARPIEFIVGDDLIGVAGVTLKSDLDPDNATNAQNIMRHEGTNGAPGMSHWSYMDTDEFMLRLESKQPGLDGLCHAFMKGYKSVTQTYHDTNSKQAVVMEVRQRSLCYGDDPYQFITNRAAAS